jgi:hypothetical protein
MVYEAVIADALVNQNKLMQKSRKIAHQAQGNYNAVFALSTR